MATTAPNVAGAPATAPAAPAARVAPVVVYADSTPTHMTRLPPGFVIVRILQLLFAVTLVGLFGFAASVQWDYSDWSNISAPIGLASSAFTCIILIWLLLARYFIPELYNYWAVLAFEIVEFLLWIDCLFWTAVWANEVFWDAPEDCTDSYDITGDEYIQSCAPNPPSWNTLSTATPFILAFTVAELILYLVSMIVVSVFISRHRRAGGHSAIGSVAPAPISLRKYDVYREKMDLERQNLEMQGKYLALQQKYIDVQKDLQKQAGLARPQRVHTEAQREVVAGPSGLKSGRRESGRQSRSVSPVSAHAEMQLQVDEAEAREGRHAVV